jgi:hypothetical protein
MHRISARVGGGLTACLAAAALAGCATAPASGEPAPPNTVVAPAASTGTPARCLRTTTITLAGNGKTYCFRVGQKLDVFLRGTVASMWQEPQVSGNVLRGVPNGALSLVAGLTGASYATVRVGRAVLTSVRSPCPTGGSCAPDHQFRAVIIVVRLPRRAGRGIRRRLPSAARTERTVVSMDNRNVIRGFRVSRLSGRDCPRDGRSLTGPWRASKAS